MKLISLSIENFGKLHRYDLTLESGLNTVCEENGWGKSTLAAFLKAMFYGLPKSSKKSLDENDYKRYTPWQGGFFGGNLVFSCQKGTFRVERSFGERESFALYDLQTGLPSAAFSESLGAELFGVDAEGFEQSVFLSSRPLKPKDGNDSVRAKLTGIEEIHDMSGFEKAFDLLDARAKDYKKRGGAGYIGDTEAKIRATKDQLAAARAKLQEQAAVERELEDLRRAIAAEETAAKDLQTALLRANQVEELRAFQGKTDELLRRQAELARQFDGEIPSREEIAACRKQLHQMEVDRAELAATGLNPEEEARLVELSRRFPTGAPDAEALKEKLRLAAALREEQIRIRQESAAAERDLAAAEKRLSELPSQKELATLRRLLAASASPAKTGFAPPAKVIFILSLVLLPLGAAALIYGALSSRAPFLFGGIAALGFGLCGLIGALLSRARQKRAILAESVRLTAQINQRLRALGLPEAADARAALALLAAQIEAAEPVRASASAKLLELQARQSDHAKTSADLRAFLASYSISEPDAESGLFALSGLAREWEALWKKHSAAAQTQAQKKAALAQAFQETSRFLARCRTLEVEASPAENLEQMERLCADLDACRKSVADRREELQSKLAALGIPDLSLLEKEPDAAALLARQKELEASLAARNDQKTRLAARLGKLTAETEQVPEWEEDLVRLQETLADQKKRYDLLVKTRDLLARAHEDLTTRYLAPTRERFATYLSLLCGKDLPQATLAADFSVTILDSGASRVMESYSRGWRDLLDFCVRLALIDALYAEGEVPFLLLDDPFANLDEERLAAAKALLVKLAAERQILYLVCHAGRA